ncbi:hypothetical protein V6N13_039333 [Hibiscus sabdariffa]
MDLAHLKSPNIDTDLDISGDQLEARPAGFESWTECVDKLNNNISYPLSMVDKSVNRTQEVAANHSDEGGTLKNSELKHDLGYSRDEEIIEIVENEGSLLWDSNFRGSSEEVEEDSGSYFPELKDVYLKGYIFIRTSTYCFSSRGYAKDNDVHNRESLQKLVGSMKGFLKFGG